MATINGICSRREPPSSSIANVEIEIYRVFSERLTPSVRVNEPGDADELARGRGGKVDTRTRDSKPW
jgi:hypothetical protein